MTIIDPLMEECIRAEREGRFGDSLRMIQERFAQLDRGAQDGGASFFITMFQWEMLTGSYMPARAALARERDAQAARVLAGEYEFGARDNLRVPSRFSVVAGMNETLNDPASTHALFVRLFALDREAACANSWLALPSIVGAGDFALAERFLPQPLDSLDHLNFNARSMPLFPERGKAPRLAAELTNFARELKLRVAILRGLKRDAEAGASETAALAGLENEEMRRFVRQELESEGAIFRALHEKTNPEPT